MQQLATCARSKSLSVDAGGLVPLEEVFLDVDSTALAAASIAQVYIACWDHNCSLQNEVFVDPLVTRD